MRRGLTEDHHHPTNATWVTRMINHRIVKGRVGNGVNGAMVVEAQELGRAGEIVVVRAVSVSRSMVWLLASY